MLLRSMRDYDYLTLEDAIRLDPERMAWAQFVRVRHYKNGNRDVVMAISHDRYAAMTAELTTAREIAAEIAYAVCFEANEVVEEEWARGEVECVPACSDDSVFGPHALVVEWDLGKACHVNSIIADSPGDVGCIELTRLGRMGRKSVAMAVTLPVSLFDADH